MQLQAACVPDTPHGLPTSPTCPAARPTPHAFSFWFSPERYWHVHPSASYRQVDTIMGCHQYTISGYSLARSLGTGTRLCSDFFEVAGQLFR